MKKEKTSRWYLNKYLIALTLFAVWMVFFDTNSMINQYELKQKLNHLQADTAFFHQETKRYQEMTRSLDSDMEVLEKLGREEYGMKRDDEIIFVIKK